MHSIVRFALLCFICVTGFSACQSQKLTSQSDTGRQLIFGSGGGFSGQIIEYVLLENGQLSRTNSLTRERAILKALPGKETQTYFEQAKQLKLATMNFKHPGNLYYFIRLEEGENEQEVVWGDINHPVPAQVQNLYQSLEKSATQ